MIYTLTVELDVRADSEKEARDRMYELLVHSMRIDIELGLEDWEIVDVVQQTTDSS